MIDAPELPPGSWTTAAPVSVKLRYDDVAQDARLKARALPPALGEACWAPFFGHPAMAALSREGIVPILRRLVIVTTDAPLAATEPIEARGGWALCATSGGPRRFLLDMRTSVTGRRGRTHGPPPEGAGEEADVGVVFAEHVLSRPFAPPEQRRVEALPAGLEVLAERPWQPLDAVGAGRTLGAAATYEHRFALADTDSNRHVNSLVYPALFEACAVSLWDRPDLMLRAIDVVWRKPSFAGDRVRVRVARIEGDASDGPGRLGVIATLEAQSDEGAAPRCRAELWLG